MTIEELFKAIYGKGGEVYVRLPDDDGIMSFVPFGNFAKEFSDVMATSGGAENDHRD